MLEMYLPVNPVLDPHLNAWAWEIPIYLFLGGMVAGLMIIGGGLAIAGRAEQSRSVRLGSLLAPIAIGVGLLALLLDLARPLNAYRFYMTFKVSSPMSWGSWILLVAGVAMVGFAWRLWLPARSPNWLGLRWLGWSNLVLGIGLGVYTGFLLSVMPARPLWNSLWLPPLFLLSGLSAGLAVLTLLNQAEEEHRLLVRLDIGVVVGKIVLIGLYGMELATGGPAAKAAISLLAVGAYAVPFWIGVIGIGMVVPLLLEVVPFAARRWPRVVGLAASAMVLVGGFTLRWILVFAGQIAEL